MTKQLKDDSIMGAKRHRVADLVAIPEMKLVALLAAAATMGGCAIYSDGTIGSAFDQNAIKAELARAEKEYGNR
jgi:hypothetical protein